jgi:hypothetical protein
MEDDDPKAGHLVGLIYRDSGRGVNAWILLSEGMRVSNNVGGLSAAA